MRKIRITVGTLLALSCLVAHSMPSTISAAQDEAVVRVAAPDRATVDDEISVDIVVDNVTNLGGFEFILTFDSEVLGLISTEDGPGVTQGPFLGSSRRDVLCPEAEVQGEVLRFACVTLGPMPPGVNGGGVLATVRFRVRGAGESSLSLSRVRIVHPDGEVIASSSLGGVIEVSDDDSGWNALPFVMLAVAIVIAAAVVLAVIRLRSRRREPDLDKAFTEHPES